MASIVVRNLDPEVVERLKERARRNGRSLEAEVRMILGSEAAAAPSGPSERVAEEAPRYETDDVWARLRFPPGTPALRQPKRRGKPRPFTPLPQTGEPASRMLIRERR